MRWLYVFEPSIWYETPEEFYCDYTEQDNRYFLIKIALLLSLGEDFEPLGRWPEYDPPLEATWTEKNGSSVKWLEMSFRISTKFLTSITMRMGRSKALSCVETGCSCLKYPGTLVPS